MQYWGRIRKVHKVIWLSKSTFLGIFLFCEKREWKEREKYKYKISIFYWFKPICFMHFSVADVINYCWYGQISAHLCIWLSELWPQSLKKLINVSHKDDQSYSIFCGSICDRKMSHISELYRLMAIKGGCSHPF